MLKVETTAEVAYTCYLTGDKEKMVRDYAESHSIPLKKALERMYFSDGSYDLELYDGATESDFSTTEIVYVEQEDENV